MIHVMIGFGTRPEAVKIAPLARLLRNDPRVRLTLVSTSQHTAGLKPILCAFGLESDVELAPAPNVCGDRRGGGASPLSTLVSHVIAEGDRLLAKSEPDVMLVQGDTTSAFALALAAFHRGVPVGHVEAGLRSDDRTAPFPEEVNRRFITNISSLHFAPTEHARRRLLLEEVDEEQIFVVGNTVIDSLLWAAERLGIDRETAHVGPNGRRRVLITAHRRENWRRLAGIARAAGAIHDELPDVEITLPLHPNPAVRSELVPRLEKYRRIHLVDALDYEDFVREMATSDLILSDSGGVQEEAPLFGTRVLVLRDTTERPEALETGLVELVGLHPERIVPRAVELLSQPAAAPPSLESYPFGDGRAAERITRVLRTHFAKRGELSATA